jgi:hypothetical protein
MLKKWLLLLLALTLLLTLAACDKGETPPPSSSNNNPQNPPSDESSNAPVVAHSGTLQDGAITWKIYSNGKMVVGGSGELPDFDRVEDQPWWLYGDDRAYGDRNPQELDVVPVTSLVIEEGITALGENAFAEQESLTAVTLPSTLSTLPVSCFKNCVKLRTVSGGTALVTIDDGAFCGCTMLDHIELSSALTKVCWTAFDGLRTSANRDLKLKVSFRGTQAQWSAVTIDSGNEALENAQITYVTE